MSQSLQQAESKWMCECKEHVYYYSPQYLYTCIIIISCLFDLNTLHIIYK